jgi:hypothetical protein
MYLDLILRAFSASAALHLLLSERFLFFTMTTDDETTICMGGIVEKKQCVLARLRYPA